MTPFQRKLSALSRDRSFLIRATVIIIAISVVAGFGIGQFSNKKFDEEAFRNTEVERIVAYESERDRKELADLLLERGGDPTPEAVAQYITFFEAFVNLNLIPRAKMDGQAVREQVPVLHAATLAVESFSSSLGADQKALFLDYVNALYEKGAAKQKALESLQAHASDVKPPRFANEFLGQVLSRDHETRAEALAHFQAEVEQYPRSDFSRYRQLDLNLDLGNYDAVRTLVDDPSYRKLVPPYYAGRIGVKANVPQLVFDGIVNSLKARFLSNFAPLALIAGLVWFIILAKLGGVHRLRSGRLLLYSLAVVAGFLSIPLGHIFITIQEDVFGFRQNGEMLNDIIYCISGIGLREETVKILLFLPFVPFIAKKRTSLEILVTAGCVGLGFAIVENMGYFLRGGPGEAFPRNVGGFLHIAWTSLLGLAVCRFWHYPKQCWEELVGTFVAVVLLHGIYDAFIIVPELARQLSFISFILLVLIGRHYFRKLIEFRETRRHIISPLGVFVIGSAITIGASWIFAMRYYEIDQVIEGVGKGALMSAILAFVFINEFRNE